MYCSQADILERISQEDLARLTDDTDGQVIDESVVSRAIADADAEINGYVAVRHRVPLDPVPELIRKLSVELAIYHMYSRRVGAPEEWRTRYEDNQSQLKALSAGKMSLGVGDPDTPPVSPPADVQSRPRIHSRDSLEDF